MVIAIIVLSILLLAALALIFCLSQVLKNTFSITDNMLKIIEGKISNKHLTAYDGKYYPGTVIAQMKFNADSEMLLTDFSMYESHKLVGFTIYTKDSMEKYYGMNFDELEEEDLELLERPVVFKNVVVYAPQEGIWTWKQAD